MEREIMPPFIPGLQLSEMFFHEAVQPILDRHFPGLVYSAARLDAGSDVLGFDTPHSRDHGWGPKCTLFLGEADFKRCAEDVSSTLSAELPCEIHGYSTHFASPHIDGGWLQRISNG